MNKNLIIFLLSLSIMPLFLLGQDFDESFLKSLPDEVRSDLLQRTADKDKLEEIQYRRPSSFIEKPAITSSRYGASIFSMMQSTLMPLNEPNYDSNYVLDFGDILELQLIGQKSSISKLTIKRDGSVSIPDIGKVYLSGISLSKAEELINSKIQSSAIGVSSFLTLINVRDIQIIVAGDVYNPGPYTINGNSNIFHALSVAGGPSEIGSYRAIDLIRNSEVIESIDLYETFIFGKSNFKARLRSGDLVFVRPIKNSITVEGAVKRPGKYELTDEEDLSLAILFANGTTNEADFSDIRLISILDGKVQQININEITELGNFIPQNNDRIFIRKYPLRTVLVKGAVRNPGSYLMNEGDGILELISQAGGYLDSAYPFAGVLENQMTKQINQIALNKLYESFLDSLVNASAGSNNSDQSSIIQILQEIKNSPGSGRVSAEFNIAKITEDPNLDITLQEGDVITIPEYLDQVYVFGEVSNEGTMRFQSGMKADFYIKNKGGLTGFANKKEIFVLHPNGETYKISNKNLFMNPKKNIDIFAGSVIFIPRKQNNRYLISQSAQAYAAILGNIGVSLASISVLKD